MELGIKREIKNNKYYVEITTAFRDNELALMQKFGEPSIDVGGTFTGPPELVLGNNTRKIRTGFPYTYFIDGESDADAKDKMIVWSTEIRVRLVTAISTLRGLSDNYSGEILETV